MMYLRWQRAVPAWLRIVPVELPGRGARMAEPFQEDFDRLVAQLCAEQATALAGRHALFGHSMGARLAWGMARRQQALGGGVAPLALFASGSPAPECADASRYAGTDDAALVADLRRRGGTPEGVFDNAALLRLTLDTLRADHGVCRSASLAAQRLSQASPPPPPLATPVHVLSGREDDIAVDHLLAWRHETTAPCTLDWFEGGHFFLRGAQESRVLAVLLDRLAAAQVGDAGQDDFSRRCMG
jgi:surfactin synthase thioesterase subunit